VRARFESGSAAPIPNTDARSHGEPANRKGPDVIWICKACDRTLARRFEAHGVVWTDTDYGHEQCPVSADGEHKPTRLP
jgi:hypothetical protein